MPGRDPMLLHKPPPDFRADLDAKPLSGTPPEHGLFVTSMHLSIRVA